MNQDNIDPISWAKGELIRTMRNNDNPVWTSTEDIKKDTDYWLTYDFWPHGGKKVRLKKKEQSKGYGFTKKGTIAIMVSDEKKEFILFPGNVIFNINPEEEK